MCRETWPRCSLLMAYRRKAVFISPKRRLHFGEGPSSFRRRSNGLSPKRHRLIFASNHWCSGWPCAGHKECLDFVAFLYKQITKIDYQSVIKFWGNVGCRLVRHSVNGKENSHWQASAPNGAIVLSQWGRLTSKLAGNPIASEQHHRCQACYWQKSLRVKLPFGHKIMRHESCCVTYLPRIPYRHLYFMHRRCNFTRSDFRHGRAPTP